MNSHRFIHTTLYGFILLAVGTLAAVDWVEPYQQTGNELLKNHDFSAGLSGWEQAVAGKVVLQGPLLRLHLDDNTGDARVEQGIDNAGKIRLLRLAADIKSRDIDPGSYDENGNWLAVPHGVADLAGTRDWRHVERVFEVSPMTAELKVIAMLYRATGTVWFKNLSLIEIGENKTWRMVKIAAILLWGGIPGVGNAAMDCNVQIKTFEITHDRARNGNPFRHPASGQR